MLLWLARQRLLWHQEWAKLLTVVVGFCGVLFIYNPFQSVRLDIIALLCGLGGGALGAIAYLNVRLLGQSGEPEWRTVLLFSATTSVTGLVAVFIWGSSGDYTPQSVLALLGIGVFGMLAQLSMTRAFGKGQATLSATLQYSTIVFAAIWGELFWQEHIGISSLIGIALVIAAGVGASYLGLRKSAPA
jgi:S-adenosylmethionine uptake transporter